VSLEWNRVMVVVAAVTSIPKRAELTIAALGELARQTDNAVVAVVSPQHRTGRDCEGAMRSIRAALLAALVDREVDWILYVEDDVRLARDFAKRADASAAAMMQELFPHEFGLAFFSLGRAEPGINRVNLDDWTHSQCVLIPRDVATEWTRELVGWVERHPEAQGGPDFALRTAFRTTGVDLYAVTPNAAQHVRTDSAFRHSAFDDSPTFEEQLP
jgi:hypothetical protein